MILGADNYAERELLRRAIIRANSYAEQDVLCEIISTHSTHLHFET